MLMTALTLDTGSSLLLFLPLASFLPGVGGVPSPSPSLTCSRGSCSWSS